MLNNLGMHRMKLVLELLRSWYWSAFAHTCFVLQSRTSSYALSLSIANGAADSSVLATDPALTWLVVFIVEHQLHGICRFLRIHSRVTTYW
jgi:hypothetical protein